MNALVRLGMNTAGLAVPGVLQRLEAAADVASMATAKLLGGAGIMPKAAVQTKAETLTGTSGMDQDMFLQLLVEQMQYQDPLDPVDNTDMVAQLAQFTSLEQMNNLNNSFEILSGNIDQLNFISAGALVGKQVAGVDVDGLPVEGTVEAAQLQGSIVYLTVDGRLVSMAHVESIGE